eukprot:m.237203 g.237203  ORF g.237203 m.237203 type:complete len:1290 (-) comp33701_c0_seq1:4-3873(-)
MLNVRVNRPSLERFAWVVLMMFPILQGQGCVLTCDQTTANRCPHITVQTESKMLLQNFKWSFSFNRLQPDFEIARSWKLENLGITSIALGVSIHCFPLAPGEAPIDTSVIAINLDHNHITEIRVLHELFNETYVSYSLRNNSLTSIPPNFLAGFNVTENDALTLAFDSNQITSIDHVTASFTGSILNVSFRENQLTTLSSNIFADFDGASLIVDVSYNVGGLPNPPADLLGGYHGVRLSLVYEGNGVKIIPPGFLQSFTASSLYIYLSDNEIEVLPRELFYLDAKDLHIFFYMVDSTLKELDKCQFSYFNGNGLNVFLSGNNVETIPPLLFGACSLGGNFTPASVSVDLSYNKIVHPGISPFKLLTHSTQQVIFKLGHNDITMVPEFYFAGVNGGSLNISMSHNQISTVNTNAFSTWSAQHLEVNLSMNTLTQFPHLGELQLNSITMDLSFNQISDVGRGFSDMSPANADVMLNNNSLYTDDVASLLHSYTLGTATARFVFDNNYVEAIPDYTFSMKNSKPGECDGQLTVSLANNQITFVGPASFWGFPGLSFSLDLRCNANMEFPTTLMLTENGFVLDQASIYNFESFYVNLAETGVGIEALSAFSSFQGSTLSLDFSDNGITVLPPSVTTTLADMYALEVCKIGLSNNAITRLPPHAFAGATHLDLSHNLITLLAADTFSHNQSTAQCASPSSASTNYKLQWLDLTYNSITMIDAVAMPSSTEMVWLNLSHNLLEFIPQSIQESLPNLAMIDLSYNRIEKVLQNNRLFQRSMFVGNTIECEKYWPELDGCKCQDDVKKYTVNYCGYSMCSEYSDGCPSGSYIMSECAEPHTISCMGQCEGAQFLTIDASRQHAFCKDYTVCDKAFLQSSTNGSAPVYLPAYQFSAPTITSDRVCAVCSTCPVDSDGYEVTKCTATEDSRCTKITVTNSVSHKLSSGQAGGLAFGVIIAVLMIAALCWWGLNHKSGKRKTLHSFHVQSETLELKSRLLDEEEQKTAAAQQSWKISWGDLELTHMLGRGSFGVVSEAWWFGTRVAVKVLLSADLVDTTSEAFTNEVMVMQSLHHPNLVTFYGFGTTGDGKPFLVTERMKGTLRSAILRSPKIVDWTEARRWCADIISGMHFLHTRSPPLMHRDLKSDNCLLGDNEVVQIADFGTVTRPTSTTRSRASSDDSRKWDSLAMTASAHAGTPLWMAPEMMQGRHGVSHYSLMVDVYSYAMVMYEIATRGLPFPQCDEMSPNEFREYVTHGGRPQIPQTIPESFKEMMEACWSPEATKRPSFRDLSVQIGKLSV